ncbi:S-adenosyl-L-methionine-dependent methyltransferase [Senna tora]|uniref:S-adenosyl-L-methionine-dependent methyltransferase n=1 Tax=Senna tora TaxID=362788 RepID=A0A834T149_9FABA|nr:S-adenosyl-L-methionine-dependent methyltransferase [Senna tora]
MAHWSAENATKAYLTTLKMGQRGKEPDVAEFISALAAGTNAQKMVVAGADAADSAAILLALTAAAHQTHGQVICIVQTLDHLASEAYSSKLAGVEFLVGDARQLLATSSRLEGADFVLVDYNLERHEEVVGAVRGNNGGTVVVGYNAMSCKGCCWWNNNCGRKSQLLPIGGGLVVTRFGGSNRNIPKYGGGKGKSNKSRWVVTVDKCTGEEHVFRVRVPHGRVIHA